MDSLLCTSCGKTYPDKKSLIRNHFVNVHKHDIPVLVQYPPDPLHVVYLGPVNDVLSKLEEKYPEVMDEFYKENSLTKKGQGIGGTFNGTSIKDILKEKALNQLEAYLPPECELVISYLKNLREIHRVYLAKEIDPDFEVILANISASIFFLL